MEMDIEELKRLSGMKKVEEDMDQGPPINEMLGRIEGYVQDLRSIAAGKPGSGQGVISAIENNLAAIKPSFPK